MINTETTAIKEATKKGLDDYKDIRKEEQRVLNYIMKVWSKGRWEVELGTFEEDLLGIDAKGIQRNKSCADTKLLIQIKTDTWLSLPSLKKKIYLRKISENMTKLDPEASQRLLVYRRTGKKIRLWNYSIANMLKKD